MDPAAVFRAARNDFAARDWRPSHELAKTSVFAKFATDPDFPALVATEDYKIFVTAQCPYAGLYANKTVGEKTASGSFAHLLAIPVKPLYNAVALNANRHTSLLVDMAEGLRACMRDPQLRAMAVAKVRANAERSPNFPTWKAVFEEDARAFLESHYSQPEDVELSVNVAPHHSVPYLHVHGMQANLRTNKKQDHKSTPLDVVIHALEAEMVDDMLDECCGVLMSP